MRIGWDPASTFPVAIGFTEVRVWFPTPNGEISFLGKGFDDIISFLGRVLMAFFLRNGFYGRISFLGNILMAGFLFRICFDGRLPF